MTTEQLTLKNVAIAAATWSREDLEGLKALAENLLNASSIEERAIPALHLLMQGSKGGGYFEDKIINGNSYRYLRYRFDKRLRSIYLGRTEAFVSPLSRRAEAARGFRKSSRAMCRLVGILQSLNPVTPLDVAILTTDLDQFSSQMDRVTNGKPPQKNPRKSPRVKSRKSGKKSAIVSKP
jgi:hypothetical protein